MAPWSIIMVMALLSTALTAEDCFSSGSRSDCNTKVHELEEDAKQAFESTMVSCLKEVKGDTQDVDQLKQAVCATPVLKRKFLECFKNDLAGALVENTIFNHQIRSRGREILKCYEDSLK
ncbi:uncharacterized protein LOC119391038 isoform X1 [Rhipicephalus sanguineus]|uniref:uncharacterized protein LOC119391038 isoform X1 n=1 Tax=Rhipicephalus sanguineus TaxID=34632 RepID=UPI0018948377|nr:uncharacterized protein LOC119391038 isoform X1 [Rhipicephalus sanguineus]